MAGLSFCGTVSRIMLFITVVLVVSTVFQYPFSVGLNALGVDDTSTPDVGFMIKGDLLEAEESSWAKPAGKTVKNIALIDKRILKFVDRILELENSLLTASQGSLSNQQMCQLKQMKTQLKLVKTLFERSVFLMKLADVASHRTDSSPWIAWDQLEPATRELEEKIKTLHLQDEKDKDQWIYICFTRESIIAVSFILMTISCLLLAHKVVQCLRRR